MTNTPRIKRIEKKYETNGIEFSWSNPNITSGSILIYRSDTGKFGTYSVIATDNLTDNVYSDTAGSEDSFYKIQIWDGIGSSPFSASASIERFPYLCTDLEVRKVLKLSANQDDIGSEEIEDSILDAQDEIYGEFGKPIQRTYTLLSSSVGSEYFTKENREPIYRLDRVEFAGSRLTTGSYTVDLSSGIVTFQNTFISSEANEVVQFEWTPKVFNLLAKNMAARDLLDDFTIKDGEDITNPKLAKIEMRIKRYRDNIAIANLPLMSSQFATYDERNPVFVDQAYVKDQFLF